MPDQTAQSMDPFAYPTNSTMTPTPAVTPTVPVVPVQMPAANAAQSGPLSSTEKNRSELEALIKRQEAGNAQEQPVVIDTTPVAEAVTDIPVPLPPMPTPTVAEVPATPSVAPIMPAPVVTPKEPPMPETPVLPTLPVQQPMVAPVVNPMPSMPVTVPVAPMTQESGVGGSNDARIAKLEREMTELRQQLAKLNQTVSQWV